MEQILDLERYPLEAKESTSYRELVERCRQDLKIEGMFNLEGFMKPEAIAEAIEKLTPAMEKDSFTHQRRHNIYFRKSVPGLAENHPALSEFETINHTLCADQLSDNPVMRIYEWQPLVDFLTLVMEKDELHLMEDPLARANVMAYRDGEALNWHFDRSEFTTTLLLQVPESGGEFEYRTNLRTADNPNYEGVARLLAGNDAEKKRISVEPGTLNVFRGVNTPHRVTTVKGKTERIIAVFSYYEQPGVVFSPEEQKGFYGRTA